MVVVAAIVLVLLMLAVLVGEYVLTLSLVEGLLLLLKFTN